jgi:hypothetical protein
MRSTGFTVRPIREAEKPIAEVAWDLGINAGTLGNWVNIDRRRPGRRRTANLHNPPSENPCGSGRPERRERAFSVAPWSLSVLSNAGPDRSLDGESMRAIVVNREPVAEVAANESFGHLVKQQPPMPDLADVEVELVLRRGRQRLASDH